MVANYKDASCYPHELVDAYKVIPAEGDIAEPEAVRGVFQQCLRVAGPPDILVSNAGIYPRVDVLDMSLAAWDEVQAVNLRGGLLCMQEAGRLMLTRRTGSIVMIASDAPFKGSPRGAHYAASKAGLLALTRCFARRLSPHGVRVNAIAPGVIDTAQPNLSPQDRIDKARDIPLGRVGDPLDVAKVALYLASPLSGYVTGQTHYVNGGAFLGA